MSAKIVGMGAMTAIGLTAPAAAAAQRGGISGRKEHPYMLDGRGDPMCLATVPWGDPEANIVERLVALGLRAAAEALQGCQDETVVDVMLALPEPRPGLPNKLADEVMEHFAGSLHEHIRVNDVIALPQGHSGGLALIAAATRQLDLQEDRLILVGGMDSWLVPETLDWLDSSEVLHCDSMPWGFCPGEAAAFCLLSSASGNGHLSILGGGRSTEANRMGTEGVCTGTGLSTAWRNALKSRTSAELPINQIWCDLNGAPYRADELAFSITRVREDLSHDLEISTPADCWGDIGAASGPLLLIAAEFAAAKHYAAGPVSLLSGSSEAGARAAVLTCDATYYEGIHP